MELSIVIPAYRESRKIARDVQEASAFLARHGIQGEVIIADDGSPDGTADVARQTAPTTGVELVVLGLAHKGKGWAVRQGMAAARGEMVMFADSGVCVPYDDMLPMLDALRKGECQLAHGSRKMRGAVISHKQSLKRRVLSWAFRKATLVYLSLPRNLTDTQCGFKAYRGDVARRLYGACTTDGFMFDLEVLIRAMRLGYTVKEFPVHWAWDPDSRLRPSAILGNTIHDLRALKRRMHEETLVAQSDPKAT